MEEPDLENNARMYGRRNRIRVYFRAGRIGSGQDGCVWWSSRKSAIKAFHRFENYRKELECYTRFQQAGVGKIGEFNVPKLIAHDDELRIIEIEIVVPPFVLDFGKVHIDQRPDYSEETMAEWRAERMELFDDNWAKVQALLGELISRFGIYYMDPKPGNISFPEDLQS